MRYLLGVCVYVASTVYERVCVWYEQTVCMDSVGYKRRLVWGVAVCASPGLCL